MPYQVTAAISPLGMIAVIAIMVLFAFLTQALADRVENYFVWVVSTGVVGYLISPLARPGTDAATHRSRRFVQAGVRSGREGRRSLVRSEQERRAPADPRRQRDPALPIRVDAGDRVIA
jgi:hypothetical protein